MRRRISERPPAAPELATDLLGPSCVMLFRVCPSLQSFRLEIGGVHCQVRPALYINSCLNTILSFGDTGQSKECFGLGDPSFVSTVPRLTAVLC